MSASKVHYRLCKDFMNVAFRYYQLDNFVGGIDCTHEVDPDDIDEVFSLTPLVLQTAGDFAVSLKDVMESDEIEAPVKNIAAFLASVVQHWADTARMAESAFRNLLIRQERSNIDENLAILDQMVEDYEDEPEDDIDDLDEDEPEDEGGVEDNEDAEETINSSDDADDISDVYDEVVDDASGMEGTEEVPESDGDYEEVSEDTLEDMADSETVPGDGDASVDGTDDEEDDGEIFTHDSEPQIYGVIEREVPITVPDDEDETPEAPSDVPVDKAEKRFSLDDVKRIITNEDPIPVEIVSDVAEYYSKKVVVDDIVRSATGNVPKTTEVESVSTGEEHDDSDAVHAEGPVDGPQRIEIATSDDAEASENPEVAVESVESGEEKPKRGLRGLGRSGKSSGRTTKPKEKKSTSTGTTRRSRKPKTEGGEE